MSPSSSDTLDMSPFSPISAGSIGVSGVIPQDPANKAAIEAARQLIASLPDTPVHTPGTITPPTQTTPAQVATLAPQASELVMPAATVAAQPLAAMPSAVISEPVAVTQPQPVLPTAMAAPATANPVLDLPAFPTPAATPAVPVATPVTAPRRPRSLPSRLTPIAVAIGSFLLLFILFRSPVILSQIQYLVSKKPDPVTSAAPASTIETVPPGTVLNIPKINVSAPIIFAASNEESAFQKDLEKGVVQYANTSKPGQPGNTVIFGHSSNDWWEPGNYKFAFVLLDKLVVGDTFSINYEQKKYVYQVSLIKVVEPTDLSVLAPTTEPSVSLITCTPPGTSWKRLVVQAKQISPTPGTTEVVAPKATPTAKATLPGNAPSFFDQIGDLWNKLIGKK